MFRTTSLVTSLVLMFVDSRPKSCSRMVTILIIYFLFNPWSLQCIKCIDCSSEISWTRAHQQSSLFALLYPGFPAWCPALAYRRCCRCLAGMTIHSWARVENGVLWWLVIIGDWNKVRLSILRLLKIGRYKRWAWDPILGFREGRRWEAPTPARLCDVILVVSGSQLTLDFRGVT
jgi:hypothetical protein